MEEQLSPLAVTHLLQHTLRSLCIHHNSQWVYAVFWRILPRNYPPPKWDSQGGAYDRSRGNRRNWILVWEDGFCNFAASAVETNAAGGECPVAASSAYGNLEYQHYQGLQPELFFKMSHEIYNYGEGLIGKVAADHGHKWIYKEPNDQEINFLSAWHNSADSHPRTWEAQFQSGIKTIALIAVREGVVQLGSVQKVIEDLSYIVQLRKKFSYIESIPGVLLPHPSSSSSSPSSPYHHHHPFGGGGMAGEPWQNHHHQLQHNISSNNNTPEFYDQMGIHQQAMMRITPSMSSLEALLSKLPSVVPAAAASSPPPPLHHHQQQHHFVTANSRGEMEFMGGMEKVAKEEEADEEGLDHYLQHKTVTTTVGNGGEEITGIPYYNNSNQYHFNNHHHHHHHQYHGNGSGGGVNVSTSTTPNTGF